MLKSNYLILFVIFLIYLLAYFFLVFSGSFMAGTSDFGVKYLQIHSLSQGQKHIDYPARDLDPTYRHFPDKYHVYEKNGKIYSVYPNIFPLICSFFYKFFGISGLCLVPLIFGFLLIFFSWILAKELLIKNTLNIYILLLALCTPILYYSTIVWEHTFSNAMFFAGLILIIKSNLPISYFICGISAGLAAITRTEFNLWFLALFVGIFIIHKFKYLLKIVLCLAGYSITLAAYYLLTAKSEQGLPPFYAFNFFAIGLNKIEFVKPSLQTTIANYILCILKYLFGTGFLNDFSVHSMVLPSIYVSCLFLFLSLKNRNSAFLWILSCVLLSIASLCAIFSKYIFGLFSTCPLVFLFVFLQKKVENSMARLFKTCALLGTILVIISGHTGEYCWGPRFLLPLFPLILVLICNEMDSNIFSLRHPVVYLVSVISLIIQLQGIIYKSFYVSRMHKNEFEYARTYKKNTLFIINDNSAYVTYNLLLMDVNFYFENKIISANTDGSNKTERMELFKRISCKKNINDFVVISSIFSKADFTDIPEIFKLVEKREFRYLRFYEFKRQTAF